MNKILISAMLLVIGMLAMPNAAAISVLNDGLTDDGAGQVSRHQIDFTLDQNLPADGKIEVGFDPGFNISAFTNDTEVFVMSTPLDGSYTWSKSANRIIITRSGSGSIISPGNIISFTLGNITNPSTVGIKSIEVLTRTALDSPLEIGTTTVNIVPGPVAQFTLNTIGSQNAGVSFGITATAKDQFGNVNVDFTDEVNLSSTIGAINPTTVGFNDGTLDGKASANVFINKTGPGTVGVEWHGKLNTSNQFTVKPGVLGSIVIDNIASPKYDELPFTVTAKAYDRWGNFKSDYNGNDTLATGINDTDTRLILFKPFNAQFSGGNYSGTVTGDVQDTAVPQPTYYGAALGIINATLSVSNSSNRFNVSELPVDLINSTVVAYPPIIAEDGSIGTITVIVKNRITQEIIPGVSVSLTSDRGGIDYISPPSIQTDSSGRARFNVSSYTKGTANFTAKVKGVYTLNQKTTVYFGYDNMLHLAKGWNLISVPRQLANSDISALGTTKIARIYYYNSTSKTWTYAIYNSTSGTWSGTLTMINDGKGYWVFTSEVTDVSIVLKPLDPLQLPPEYPLKAGWNLIGYTSTELKPSILTYNYLYSLGGRWVSLYEWTGSEYTLIKPYDAWDHSVSITRGYWIYLNNDGTLVP